MLISSVSIILCVASCANLVAVWEETDAFINKHGNCPFMKQQCAIKARPFGYKPSFQFDVVAESQLQPRVIERDTLSAATDILKEDPTKKVMVVNFANNFIPGGHYKTGAPAQEEDLFRRTALSRILTKNHGGVELYPINQPGRPIRGLYTPGVRILRQGKAENFQFHDLKDPYLVDVCSIAAFNRHSSSDSKYFGSDKLLNKDGIELTRQKIEVMFQMAIANKVDVLITGAFGCGSFDNNPVQIATLFNEVIQKYGNANLQVKLAILGKKNLNTFKKIIATNIKTEAQASVPPKTNGSSCSSYAWPALILSCISLFY